MKHPTLVRRQAGNTLLGFVIGLIVGLALAALVALSVTKAPVPFMNKAAPHMGDATTAPSGPPPDPNKPLYGRDTRPSVAPAAAAPASADATPPSGTPPEGKKFSFYDLMPGRASEPAKPPQVASVSPDLSTGGDGLYSLQAGAFKSASDADAMRGRLAMLGFDAQVTPFDRNGDRLYRVRIGPVGRIDDANRAKQTLAKNGIDASLIKSQP